MSATLDDRPYKEILYLLLEKVRATKAAFYLLDPAGAFRLLASYGFGRSDKLADVIRRSDPLASFVLEHREPYIINDIRQAGRLAEMMEAASCSRILTSPLYLDGRIVGILDVRDKAGREPFLPEDVAWVHEVHRRLTVPLHTLPQYSSPVVDVPAESSIFGETGTFSPPSRLPAPVPPVPPRLDNPFAFEPSQLRGETVPSPAAPPARVPIPPSPAATAELPIDHLPSTTARAMRLVEERLSTPAVKAPARGSDTTTDAGLYRLFLETLIHLPDVELAAITYIEPHDMTVWLAGRRPLGEDAEPAIVESVVKIFSRAGAKFGLPAVRNLVPVSPPSALSTTPLRKAEIAAIQSSVLAVEPAEVGVLTLVFRSGPGSEDREGLKTAHLLVKTSLAEIRGASLYREAYRGLVNNLLEPGLKRYSALKTHSFNVARISRRLASFLSLSPTEVEQITVAGVLHDVGMRELNYEELYSKRSLSEAEQKLIREHPRTGSFLVEQIPWPYPVAPLVRFHHERWDGAGYPDGLSGEAIPYGARLIHVCEAFDAMTSPTSYRSVLSATQAVEIIVSKAGTQFDPQIAPALKKMLEAGRPDRT